MGGDQQVGALIAEEQNRYADFPLGSAQCRSRDPDVNPAAPGDRMEHPVAANLSTNDFLIQSPLFQSEVEITIPDYQRYLWSRLKE